MQSGHDCTFLDPPSPLDVFVEVNHCVAHVPKRRHYPVKLGNRSTDQALTLGHSGLLNKVKRNSALEKRQDVQV
jgi:hypothetical protein